MTVGMVATMFSKKTRFASLRKKLDDLRLKRTLSLMLFVSLSSSILAQSSSSVDSLIQANAIDKNHADKFGRLVEKVKHRKVDIRFDHRI